MGLLVIIIIVFFVLAFFLIMFGISAKPKLKSITILPQTGNLNKTCLREKVGCNTDNDCMQLCSEAQEGGEIVCKALPDTRSLTVTQQQILGSSGPGAKTQAATGSMLPPKYCVPATAKLDCNVSTGGIPVFTGWGGLNTMEFDCLCAYPLWASSRLCDTTTGTCQGNCLLNPGICQPGTFNWDLTVNPREPLASMCECANGYNMVVDVSGLPRCVPANTDSYYSDIDFVTGSQGGQPKIPVDNIPIKQAIVSGCPTGPQHTPCNGQCCMMANATCCGGETGVQFCCPHEYPVCDLNNLRCLKTKSECTGPSETQCSGGCCNTVGGTCCGDGSTCCPAAFPNCDPTYPYCNPNPTQLLATPDTCPVNSGLKQCAHGCCPIPDGVCCGNPIDGNQYCCPPDYPVCDTTLKMCRKSS
jgi:hypothetical protein